MTLPLSRTTGMTVAWSLGVINVRIRGYGLQIKAPWNEPLFSERYGYVWFWPLGFGWRFSLLAPSGRIGPKQRVVCAQQNESSSPSREQ
jgi:hypothetical protein